MLSKILKKSDCSACKFCCSFRRQSLWETPLFPAAHAKKIQELFPDAQLCPAGNSSMTIKLSHLYKTDNPDEEVPCPFLDKTNGCLLPPDLKPFDCSIWPFRAVRLKTGLVAVALTPTCPSINKVARKEITALLEAGLGKKILDYAAKNPDIIKDHSEFLSDVLYN